MTKTVHLDREAPRATRPRGGANSDPLDFSLPPELEASEPPEARGLARDEVRLMVSYRASDRVLHLRFRQIGDVLLPGDLLVLNTSGTLNAAIHATRADGTPLELHLSTHLHTDRWTVELRRPTERGSAPCRDGAAGETLRLPGGATATLLTPYARHGADRQRVAATTRLWVATLALPSPLHAYLEQHGFPIRYGYVKEAWPASYYQTAYATELGSAEMPSAGRAFTPELLTSLAAQGVRFAPLLLHTGVASLEDHEPPYDEQYRVPEETARAVNAARAEGRRVIAVGTTVVRALETVADAGGIARPGEGWTSLIVTPERGVRVVDGLLTGLHEPRASHLAMLEAIAGPPTPPRRLRRGAPRTLPLARVRRPPPNPPVTTRHRRARIGNSAGTVLSCAKRQAHLVRIVQFSHCDPTTLPRRPHSRQPMPNPERRPQGRECFQWPCPICPRRTTPQRRDRTRICRTPQRRAARQVRLTQSRGATTGAFHCSGVDRSSSAARRQTR